MSQDWKDALSAYRGTFSQPEEDREENLSDNTEMEIPQRTPVSIVIDKKGRNGKTATILEGFTVPQDIVEGIAKKLKQRLGVGGSVRDGEILIQGEHKEAVKKILSEMNFKTKLS